MLVHFDVDVIDFTDLPLSENLAAATSGSPTTRQCAPWPSCARSPWLAGVTVTELNPDHAKAEPGALERFAEALGQGPAPRRRRR